MKKQLLLLLVMILLPMVASADAVEINGIYYNLNTDGNVAEVAGLPNNYTSSIVIPENVHYDNITYTVTSIRSSAFKRCSKLTQVSIPSSVTSIGAQVFVQCSNLTSVNIPNGVTSISNYTFDGCSSLPSISIPSSVTSIGDYAFSNCSSLTSVNIPNGVTSIGDYAFNYCSSLTSVNIPNGVTSIGRSTFYYCWSLTSITIPNSVTSIGEHAFCLCPRLTSVTIGNGIKDISFRAFEGCSKISDVYCHAETIPTTNSETFNDSNIGNATLHVPSSAVEAYKAAEPWKNFKSIVALTDQETSITGIHLDENNETTYFTLDGKQIDTPRKGVNIVRTSNGKTKKVAIK